MDELEALKITNSVVEGWALTIARSRGLFAEYMDRLAADGVIVERTAAVEAVLGKLVVGDEAVALTKLREAGGVPLRPEPAA